MGDGRTGRAIGGDLDRRGFLRGAAGWPLFPVAQGLASAQEPGTPGRATGDRDSPGLISRQRHPDNLESPFSALDTGRLLTPTDQFYVRTHFEAPDLEANTWRLSVEGE